MKAAGLPAKPAILPAMAVKSLFMAQRNARLRRRFPPGRLVP
jgi:hypothetical protein